MPATGTQAFPKHSLVMERSRRFAGRGRLVHPTPDSTKKKQVIVENPALPARGQQALHCEAHAEQSFDPTSGLRGVSPVPLSFQPTLPDVREKKIRLGELRSEGQHP